MLHRKILLFGAIGFINTGVDWTGFWLMGLFLPKTMIAVWSAKAASYTLGVVTSFVLNTQLTFREQAQSLALSGLRSHTRLFIRFLSVSLLCLLINSSLYIFLAGSDYMQLFPLLIATSASYVIGFTLNNVWTYRVADNA